MRFRLSVLKKRLRYPYHVVRTLLAMAGIDKNYTKLFAIGYNKTATSSIHKVFRAAGLHAVHGTKWRKSKFSLTYCNYQAFSDGPPTDFPLLDRRIKGCKFILNVRDLNEWIDSRLEHIRHTQSKGRISKTKTWQINDFAVKSWIVNRGIYHLSVLDYFKDRPSDLLVVNFIQDPDAARKISAFIGKKVVTEKPHALPIPKQREKGTLKNIERIERCFAELGVPMDEGDTDIYCPSLFEDGEKPQWPSYSRDLSDEFLGG